MQNLNEAYEHNLKLYFDSKRKDLDILLSTTIPTQKNLMRTILWLNSSFFAFIIALISKENIHKFLIIAMSIPFLFSFFAILFILFSLKEGRIKFFGTLQLEVINLIAQDENEKIQGLLDMNTSLNLAFNSNAEIVKKRANKIAKATNLTIMSAISIFLIIIFYVNIVIL